MACMASVSATTGRTKRNETSIKKGDVVLLIDATVPRGEWPLGLIEDVYPSADGRVRSARIYASGTSYDRPVTKLVKIIEKP